MNYYNENDPKAAAWLRKIVCMGLIPEGVIDERSIADVSANDLHGFTQCHFFAGIGGWPLALRFAGWPENKPAGTGSCPCQPFSDAGSGKGFGDPRHLWPVWFQLIAGSRKLCQPWTSNLFGEQVASKAALPWIDQVFNDLETEDYACGAADLCSKSVGAIDWRQRIYWGGIADASSDGCKGIQRSLAAQVPQDRPSQALGPWNCSSDPFYEWEKLLAGACVRRLDDGVSSGLVIRPALRGFGNAINPWLAAEFVKVFCEAGGINL